MIGHISLDQDGGIVVHEGTNDEGKLIVDIPSIAFVALDFFNEGRRNFSWEGDAERAAELLLWRLEDCDLMPKVMSEYHEQIKQLCMPGGPTGNPFTIEMVDAG